MRQRRFEVGSVKVVCGRWTWINSARIMTVSIHIIFWYWLVWIAARRGVINAFKDDSENDVCKNWLTPLVLLLWWLQCIITTLSGVPCVSMVWGWRGVTSDIKKRRGAPWFVPTKKTCIWTRRSKLTLGCYPLYALNSGRLLLLFWPRVQGWAKSWSVGGPALKSSAHQSSLLFS